MSKPQQVRQIVNALPVATSPKQARKEVRAAMREVYGLDWFANGQTKGVFKRVRDAYIARNK